MAKAIIDDSILSDIADEINTKNNTNKKYKDSELAPAIASLGAVKSVNGKTGVVTLNASDVGAVTTADLNTVIIHSLPEATNSEEILLDRTGAEILELLNAGKSVWLETDAATEGDHNFFKFITGRHYYYLENTPNNPEPFEGVICIYPFVDELLSHKGERGPIIWCYGVALNSNIMKEVMGSQFVTIEQLYLYLEQVPYISGPGTAGQFAISTGDGGIDWKTIATGVSSVNNKTGVVTLNASDVGARPSSWTPTASQVGAVPSSGGTFNGNLAVNGLITAYEYSKNANNAAITMDKVGSESFGIGGNGKSMEIQYGQVSSKDTGAWSGSQNIIHRFKGNMYINNTDITPKEVALIRPAGGIGQFSYVQSYISGNVYYGSGKFKIPDGSTFPGTYGTYPMFSIPVPPFTDYPQAGESIVGGGYYWIKGSSSQSFYIPIVCTWHETKDSPTGYSCQIYLFGAPYNPMYGKGPTSGAGRSVNYSVVIPLFYK